MRAARERPRRTTGHEDFPDGFGCFELLDLIAWFNLSQTQPVGLKDGNGFGLHDMSGNVVEFVNDCFSAYPNFPVVDPIGGSSLSGNKMRRGFGVTSNAVGRLSSVRAGVGPNFAAPTLFYGFRAARNPQ